MVNKRQLIESLTTCINEECDACTYRKHGEYCNIALLHDVRELLTSPTAAQSFIVIDTTTGQEADTKNIVLHEDWAKSLVSCDIDGWAITDDGGLVLTDAWGDFVYADTERFKVKWDE